MERERSDSGGHGPLTLDPPIDPPAPESGLRATLREPWAALWTSRLVVWIAGVMGVLWFGVDQGLKVQDDASNVAAPFGAFGNLLVAPSVRWDSVWYVTIANHGYGDRGSFGRAAFYPLYPLLMRVLGWVTGSTVIAGILISLVCFLVALVLLERLVTIELGPEVARATVLLVAFFPTALFFSAVYTESLFLMLSVGAVLAARQGRWAWAGIAAALAALTRNSGLLLLVPLVLLFLYGPRADCLSVPGPALRRGLVRLRPRHPFTLQLLWLGLVPLGLGLYLLYAAVVFDDWLAPFHAQALWLRHFSPLGALRQGVHAGWNELKHAYEGAPSTFAGDAVIPLGFVVFALVALLGTLRRLPFAYGAYVAVSLALTLSYPLDAQPLISFSRYVVVLFPLQIWLATWALRRGRLERTVAMSAVLLGLMTAQFAHWGFLA